MAKIKRDDEVVVLAGKDKGKRGTVRTIVDSDRIIVSGVNMIKKHTCRTPDGCRRWHRREGSAHSGVECCDLQSDDQQG